MNDGEKRKQLQGGEAVLLETLGLNSQKKEICTDILTILAIEEINSNVAKANYGIFRAFPGIESRKIVLSRATPKGSGLGDKHCFSHQKN